MNKHWLKISMVSSLLSVTLFSCNEKDPIITPGPSNGNTLKLDGIAAGESGNSALNSVFVDFSKDETKSLRRDGWDLGFYCGEGNRVIINYTSSAAAYVTDKTDMNAVTEDDTIGVKLSFSMMDMSPEDMKLIDDVDGDLSKTVIPEIKATGNNVIIINRGTGNGIGARDFYKLLIELLPNGNYMLKYAKLDAAEFNTLEIAKDPNYNFKLVSFEKGLVEKPKKYDWDILWTSTVYKTMMGTDEVPYSYSDMIAINYLAGIQVVEKNYDDELKALEAYEQYSSTNLLGETFSKNRWAIASGWRKTATPGSTSPAGTIKTKFYIIKDADGNAYKVRFVSFTEEDGGERGRPEIKYELIK